MRSLMILLFLLFCSVQTTSSAPISDDMAKSNCCVEFAPMVIPLKKIVSFYRTDSVCPLQAIVFKTVAGKEWCVNPETSWVNSHVEKLNRRTSGTTTSAPTAKTRSSTV